MMRAIFNRRYEEVFEMKIDQLYCYLKRMVSLISTKEWLLTILSILLVCLLSLPVFFLREGTIPGDSFTYMELGRSIAFDGKYIAQPESPLFQTSYSRSPAFAILLATSFRIFGLSTSSALLITKLAFFVNMLIVYLLSSRLFNRRTGLVIASLAAGSSYMVGFAAHLEIDQVVTLFAFLGLYFIYISFEDNKFSLAFIAGVMLGISFLTKEIAIIWVPIPIYLFLFFSNWRQKRNLINLIGYFFGFGLILVIWWIYFYIATGDVFLISSRKSISNLFSDNQAALGTLLFLTLVIIVVIVLYILKRKILIDYFRNSTLFIKFKVVTRYLILLSPWLLWLIFTAFFSVTLSRLATWFESPFEIPLRIDGFRYWATLRMLPEQPLLQFQLAATVLIIGYSIWKKYRGDLILIWCLLSYMPQVLTLSIEGQYIQPARYGMWLYWLGYIVIGRSIILILDLISDFFHKIKAKKVQLSYFALIPIVSLGFWIGISTPNTYKYLKYESPSFYNVDAVKSVSNWIKQHVAQDANIGSSVHFLTALNFYTEGIYDIQRWYALRNDQTERIWPFNREIELTVEQNQLIFQDRIRKYPLSDILYLQLSAETSVVQYGQTLRTYYSTVSRNALNQYLIDLEIDYLVLSRFAGNGSMLNVMPDYLQDSPAFTIMYSTKWRENNNLFELVVIKVDRDLLDDQEYPVTINNKVWSKLVRNGENLLFDEFNIYKIIHSLGGGPIIFRPIETQNIPYYSSVANAYLENENINLAAYEYHLALQDHPIFREQVKDISENFLVNYPNYQGSWLLSGDIDYLNGDYESARTKFERALQIPNGSNYINAAVHIALGKVYSRLGSSIDSIFHFEEGLSVSAFQGRQIREELMIEKANLAQKEGQILSSINLYNSVLNPNTIPYMSSSRPRTYFDFIDKLDHAQIDSDGEGFVYPAVFIYENNPLKVLFAHPRSKITYHLDLIDNTSLVFTPLLDPTVWAFGRGDGVNFLVNLKDDKGKVYLLYSEYIDPKNLTADRHLTEEKIDLSKWSGQNVEISFITTAGPNDNDKYDWAAWGEVRLVQPYLYNFLGNFHKADLNISDHGAIDIVQQTINNEERWTLFQHPSSSITFTLQLPYNSFIYFGVGLDPAIWDPSNGDGVEYLTFLNTQDNPNRKYQIYYRYVDPKNKPEDRYWFDEKIDLSIFGGKPVDITFTVLPGPEDDYNFDWGGWSMPVLVTEKLQN